MQTLRGRLSSRKTDSGGGTDLTNDRSSLMHDLPGGELLAKELIFRDHGHHGKSVEQVLTCRDRVWAVGTLHLRFSVVSGGHAVKAWMGHPSDWNCTVHACSSFQTPCSALFQRICAMRIVYIAARQRAELAVALIEEVEMSAVQSQVTTRCERWARRSIVALDC